MPRADVPIDGLVEQDLVAIGNQRRILARGQQHRHEPDADCKQEGEWTEQPRSPSGAYHARLPLRTTQAGERDQHQQRQKADALGDDTQAGCRPTDRVPAPRRSEQQVPQQAIQAQRRPKTQRRIDLRLTRLPDELHSEQQREPRDQSRFAIP
jgi:hypothetical protein